ncbi:hypothetical protein Tco_0553047 [Tanacetum coccineum]
MGTVCFRNDHFAAIIGYGNYVHGNITIYHVYYVEGLRHNLFSVGQFYDGDLEFAFRSKTCYVCNLEGDDLLTGKEIRRMSAWSSQENAFNQFPIRHIHLLPYAVSIKITIQRYEDIYILGMNIILILNFARTPRDTPQYAILA